MRAKTCKTCGIKFDPVNPLVPYCSPKCQIRREREKNREKTEKEKERKAKARDKKRNSVKALTKKLDEVFSRYIRHRDAKLFGKCVTCDVKHGFDTLQC